MNPILKLSACICWLLCSVSAQMEIMNQWTFLKYNAPFSYPLLRNYVPENAVFTGLEVGWDRIFLATPRLWPGNPATISWIPRNSFENSGETSPALQVHSTGFHFGLFHHLICNFVIFCIRQGISKLGLAQSSDHQYGIVDQRKLYQYNISFSSQIGQMRPVVGFGFRSYGQFGHVYSRLPAKTFDIRFEDRSTGNARKYATKMVLRFFEKRTFFRNWEKFLKRIKISRNRKIPLVLNAHFLSSRLFSSIISINQQIFPLDS